MIRSSTKSLLLALLLCASTLGFAKEGWLTSYEEALAQSRTSGKPILMLFTGSDWCHFCKLLEEEVFSKEAFRTWATSRCILLEIDLPVETPQPEALKKQNGRLLFAFPTGAMPSVLFVNRYEEVIAKTGYRAGGVESWIRQAETALQEGERRLRSTLDANEGYPVPGPNKKLRADISFLGRSFPQWPPLEGWGAPIELSREKATLLAYWSEPDVQAEELFEILSRAQARFGDTLQIVIFTDRDSEEARRFAQAKAPKLRGGLDRDGVFRKSLGIRSGVYAYLWTADRIVRYQSSPREIDDRLSLGKIERILDAFHASRVGFDGRLRSFSP